MLASGQTGANRAELDWAIANGIPHEGRKAEDSRIPEDYGLLKIASADYPERAEKNVTDSDGIVIFTT